MTICKLHNVFIYLHFFFHSVYLNFESKKEQLHQQIQLKSINSFCYLCISFSFFLPSNSFMRPCLPVTHVCNVLFYAQICKCILFLRLNMSIRRAHLPWMSFNGVSMVDIHSTGPQCEDCPEKGSRTILKKVAKPFPSALICWQG